MNKERLPYIDKLKGLAMLLVVWGNTMYFCIYDEQPPFNALFNIICTFHVPLFFFLSGFVVNRLPTPRTFSQKACRFLRPMLVVGFANALLFDGVDIFLFNGGHFGYWYLLSLTIFYLLLLPFRLTVGRNGMRWLAVDVLIAATIWIVLLIAVRLPDNTVKDALNTWSNFYYWPFFIVGFIGRKYSLNRFFEEKPWLGIVLLSVYVVLIATHFNRLDNLSLYTEFTIAFIAILALLSLFQPSSHCNTFVDRQLKLIGNNTLQVYVYHYFLIRIISLHFLRQQSLVLEVPVTVVLTFAIAYFSIGIGLFVKKNWGILQRPITRNPVFYISLLFLCSISVLFITYSNRLFSELELFSDVYLLCTLTLLFPLGWRRSVKATVFGLFFFIGVIDMLCYQLMGAPLIPSIVITWGQTNGQEATEAFSTYFSLRLLFTPLILFFILPVAIWLMRRAYVTFPRSIASFLLVITLFSFAGSVSNKRYLHFVYTRTSDDDMAELCPVESNTREYLPIYRLMLSVKEISRLKHMRQRLVDNAMTTHVDSCSFRSPLIVLIIGESYNRHHASLYGYHHATTPLQDSLFNSGKLYRFDNVIASFNLTFKAFQHMLSLYDYDHHDSWYNHPLVPVLFRKAGYDVYFFSNQYSLDKRSAFSDFIEDSFINHLELSPLMFTQRNKQTHDYDIGLLDDYNKSDAALSHNPRLVMFHFIGIHNDFSQRFPPDWKYFKPADYTFRHDLNDNEKQTLADYDNAIRYNDYVVDSIINTFCHDNAVMIYVPDHGELVYDSGTEFGRNLKLKKEYVKAQFDIPFWIHCTDAYQAAHPDLCRQMAASVNRPFMTDDLPHLLLYLAGIVIPEYESTRNLIDDNFDCNRKRMIRGEADYDSVISLP